MMQVVEINQDVDAREFIKMRISQLKNDLSKMEEMQKKGQNRKSIIREIKEILRLNCEILVNLCDKDLDETH